MSLRGLVRFGDPEKKGRYNKEQHARRAKRDTKVALDGRGSAHACMSILLFVLLFSLCMFEASKVEHRAT